MGGPRRGSSPLRYANPSSRRYYERDLGALFVNETRLKEGSASDRRSGRTGARAVAQEGAFAGRRSRIREPDIRKAERLRPRLGIRRAG